MRKVPAIPVFILVLLILSGLVAAMAQQMQQPSSGTTPQGKVAPINVGRTVMPLSPPSALYAFPGRTCPAGSQPYKGPEQLPQDSGAIYCTIARRVVVIPKTVTDQCPSPAYKPYVDTKAKPDSDVIWCEFNYQDNPLAPRRPEK